MYDQKSNWARKQKYDHLGLYTGIGAYGHAYMYRTIQACIKNRGYPSLNTNIEASELTYGYRSILFCIQVQAHPGYFTSVKTPGRAYMYRSTQICIQVQGHPGLHAGIGAHKRTYGYRSIRACIQGIESPDACSPHLFESRVYGGCAMNMIIRLTDLQYLYFAHTWVREPVKATSACLQVHGYKCLHADIYASTLVDVHDPNASDTVCCLSIFRAGGIVFMVSCLQQRSGVIVLLLLGW